MRPARDVRQAVDDVVDAVRSLGIGLSAEPVESADQGLDLLLTTHDDRSIAVQVKSTSLVSADSAPHQVRGWSGDLAGGVLGLVVADRITATARDELTRQGWSWLDLRGHLRLSGPGVLIDSDVPAVTKQRLDRAGIIGPVGAELSALLLLHPGERLGVRTAAAILSRAPSSISQAFTTLRAAGLVDENRAPVLPGLFWELADHWEPIGSDVARLPAPGESRDMAALKLGLDEIESSVGWALTDTVAAADLGAPIAMRADYPFDFYVPDQATLRRAVTVLGPASGISRRAGRVKVAPVPLVCSRRVDASGWANQSWPLAHPVFVALDLSQDPGRGREILEGWTPRKPWDRVW